MNEKMRQRKIHESEGFAIPAKMPIPNVTVYKKDSCGDSNIAFSQGKNKHQQQQQQQQQHPEGRSTFHVFPLRFMALCSQLGRKRLKILVYSVLCIVVIYLRYSLFGYKTMRGGYLGKLVDCTLRTFSFRKTMRQQDNKLQELGYYLPKLEEINVNKKGAPSITHSYLAETLFRTANRLQQRQNAENFDICGGAPDWIIQPYSGSWFRPLNEKSLDFDESEMRNFMKQNFPLLISKNHNLEIWALCATYWYGGYFIPSTVRHIDELNFPNFSSNGSDGSCNREAAVMFRGNELYAIKATAKHPILHCAIKTLQDSKHNNKNRNNRIHITPDLFTSQTNLQTNDNEWITESCKGMGECCMSEVTPDTIARLFIQLDDNKLEPVPTPESLPRVEITLTDGYNNAKNLMKYPKQALRDLMMRKGCEPSWLCNRCLKADIFGNFGSCTAVCSRCYKDIICKDAYIPPRDEAIIDVSVNERRPRHPDENLIPHIIHQTWFEEISPDRYPHFVRLQNSWKNSGWDYRFYTDKVAREYIDEHFPACFGEAFDSLIPGAFKADFFRLLVLLIEGGIYADIDVKLNTNLDMFVTPNMGFFVPQDLVACHGDGSYCMWNGLIGAAPGHPFVITAIERLLNMVLNRADYYDMERDACHETLEPASLDIWRLRALEVLLLTGPCALGISINTALGRDSPVEKIGIGWIKTDDTLSHANADKFGDVLILSSDKHDMGEMRFSDVDRNILFASTDQSQLVKSPIESSGPTFDNTKHEKEKPHYSKHGEGSDVFGSVGIYTDNLVANKIYKLRTT